MIFNGVAGLDTMELASDNWLELIDRYCICHLGYLSAVPLHKCIIEVANDSADMKSVRHGQFKEKGKNSTTELNIFLSKNLSTENNKPKPSL